MHVSEGPGMLAVGIDRFLRRVLEELARRGVVRCDRLVRDLRLEVVVLGHHLPPCLVLWALPLLAACGILRVHAGVDVDISAHLVVDISSDLIHGVAVNVDLQAIVVFGTVITVELGVTLVRSIGDSALVTRFALGALGALGVHQRQRLGDILGGPMLFAAHLREDERLCGIHRSSLPALARLRHRDLLGRLLADGIVLCVGGITHDILSRGATDRLWLNSRVASAPGTGLSTAAETGTDLDEAVVGALEPRIRGSRGCGASLRRAGALRGALCLRCGGLRGGLPHLGGGPGIRGRFVSPRGREWPALRGAHFDPLRQVRTRGILSWGRRILGGRRGGAGLVVGRRVQRRHGSPGWRRSVSIRRMRHQCPITIRLDG